MEWKEQFGSLRISHGGAEWDVVGRQDGLLQVRLREGDEGRTAMIVLPSTSNQVCMGATDLSPGNEHRIRPVPGVPVRHGREDEQS